MNRKDALDKRIDDENGFFSNILNNCKSILYGATFVLLKDEEGSFTLIMISVIIVSLQVLAFAFNDVFLSIWNWPTLTDYLKLIFRAVSINYYWKTDSWTWLIFA